MSSLDSCAISMIKRRETLAENMTTKCHQHISTDSQLEQIIQRLLNVSHVRCVTSFNRYRVVKLKVSIVFICRHYLQTFYVLLSKDH